MSWMTRREADSYLEIVAQAKNLARDLVRNFAYTHDLDCADDLARNLDSVRVRDFPLAVALDLAPVLHRVRDCALDLASDLDATRARDIDLDRAFDRVDNVVRALADNLELVRAHVRALDGDLADDLNLALDRVGVSHQNLVARLHNVRGLAVPGDSAAVADGVRLTPGRAARSMVSLTVWLLPVAQRPRYRAEFSIELADLPREQQLGYALRVLTGAWKLRTALVESVRTADGEPARRAER